MIDDLVDVAQLVLGDPHLVELQQPGAVVPAQQRVADRTRLLEDLLAHEPVEAVLLGGREVPVDVVASGPRPARPSKSVTAHVVAGDRHDLVLAELHRLAGVLDERRDVGAEEVLALAEPDHQRRVAARRHHPVGVLRVDGHQGERALEPAADTLHRRRSGRRSRRARASSRCAATSVSVSERRSWPPRSSSSRSGAKFSMMPLCTTATRPCWPRCGWALTSLGAPWVAQRVCPMPVVERRQRRLLDRLLEVGQLAGPLVRDDRAVVRPGRSRRSRSRGTRAVAAPRSRRPAPACRRRTPRFRTWAQSRWAQAPHYRGAHVQRRAPERELAVRRARPGRLGGASARDAPSSR